MSGATAVLPVSQARFSVVKPSDLVDEPVNVTITGLTPDVAVQVTASARGATGVAWKSSANFISSTAGQVSLAQPSDGGDYTGANAMGLFENMSPAADSLATAFIAGGSGYPVTLIASVGGRPVANTTVERLGSTAVGVRMTKETLTGSGIYGDLFMPKTVAAGRPAVLTSGGSEGGLSTAFLASTLTAHGYPTLALAYFKEAGLPDTLSRIPLEYFVKALKLLAAQPGVDRSKVMVFGVSRGSEAALLLGSHFPDLVHGVIVGSPSAVVFPSYPPDGQAAWTLVGKPVPFASEADFLSGNPDPADAPAAVIPVEQINGPIMTVCGGLDGTWQSCRYSEAITSLLQAHHVSYPHTALEYPDAGHYVGSMAVYLSTTGNGVGGGTVDANAQASAQAHVALLTFLSHQ